MLCLEVPTSRPISLPYAHFLCLLLVCVLMLVAHLICQFVYFTPVQGNVTESVIYSRAMKPQTAFNPTSNSSSYKQATEAQFTTFNFTPPSRKWCFMGSDFYASFYNKPVLHINALSRCTWHFEQRGQNVLERRGVEQLRTQRPVVFIANQRQNASSTLLQANQLLKLSASRNIRSGCLLQTHSGEMESKREHELHNPSLILFWANPD